MVVEGSSLLEGSFMNQDAGGVQWPRVQEAWKKSAPLFAFVVTIFLVCSLLSYLCHFFRGSGTVVDSCHVLKVTLVSYPPTFLVCFLPPIHCSSQPSIVHWLSSSIFPCWLFVRPAMVTSDQISLLVAPHPQTHTFSESL